MVRVVKRHKEIRCDICNALLPIPRCQGLGINQYGMYKLKIKIAYKDCDKEHNRPYVKLDLCPNCKSSMFNWVKHHVYKE